jgi:hypothetical protein
VKDEDRRIIESYQPYFDTGMNSEDLFVLALKDGHRSMIGIGLLVYFFKMSFTDAKQYAYHYKAAKAESKFEVTKLNRT